MRICRGERWEKETPEDWRFFGAFFLFIPILVGVLFYDYDSGKTLVQKLLDENSITKISLPMIGSFIWILCLIAWIRYVPTIASWILSPIVWAIVLWLAFNGRVSW
jgi:hypothetical protein